MCALPCIFNPPPPYYRHAVLISSSLSGPTAALAGKRLRGADNKLQCVCVCGGGYSRGQDADDDPPPR